MHRLFLFLLLATPVAASDMQAACERAIELKSGEPKKVYRTEEFPELEKPRIVIYHEAVGADSLAVMLDRLSGDDNDSGDPRTSQSRCTFTRPTTPVGLTEFHYNGQAGSVWFSTGFEEIQVLLEREGF